MATTLVERVQAVEERTYDIETGLARLIAANEEAARERQEADRKHEEWRQSMERAAEEAARERQEADRKHEEWRQSMKRAAEEAARERQEADRKHKEWRQSMEQAAARREQEAHRREQEAARERQAMLQAIEKDRQERLANQRDMNKRWGDLANKWGTVVEDIVAPSVRRMALEVFGCGELVFFSPRVTRVHSDDRSRQREFDAIYVGTKGVLLNETKSSPRSKDVQSFVRFLRSEEFVLYFPECRGLPVVPVFSALSIPDDMVTNLTRHGIYALAMGEYAMQVVNLEAVRNRHAT